MKKNHICSRRSSGPFLLAVTMLLISCNVDRPFGGDFVYIRNKGADMPVWVRGNLDAEVLLVTLHGGPGASAMDDFMMSDVFERLEKEMAVAYWDQRSSGNSHGTPDLSTFTMAQFIEDTGIVIQYLANTYPRKKLFLLGHSWGGELGTGYMLDGANKTLVSGWIEVSGAHNQPANFRYGREFVLRHANKKLLDPATSETERNFWKTALEWYAVNDTPEELSNNVSTHFNTYVQRAHGYWVSIPGFVNPDLMKDYGFDALFLLPTNYMENYLVNMPRLNDQLIRTREIYSINYSPRMSSITVPSLVLWGELDGATPVECAYDAYASLGGSEKHITVIPDCAHMPFTEKPEPSYQAISSFIKRYK